MSQCETVSMWKCSNVKMSQRENVPMWKHFNVKTFQHENIPMWKRSNVKTSQCENVPRHPMHSHLKIQWRLVFFKKRPRSGKCGSFPFPSSFWGKQTTAFMQGSFHSSSARWSLCSHLQLGLQSASTCWPSLLSLWEPPLYSWWTSREMQSSSVAENGPSLSVS